MPNFLKSVIIVVASKILFNILFNFHYSEFQHINQLSSMYTSTNEKRKLDYSEEELKRQIAKAILLFKFKPPYSIV